MTNLSWSHRLLVWPQMPPGALHQENRDDEKEEEEEGDDAGGDGNEVLHLHLHHSRPLSKALDHQGVVGPARPCPVLSGADVGAVLSQGGVQDQQLAPCSFALLLKLDHPEARVVAVDK